MPLIAKKESEREFELPPADSHIATCYRVIDLGTQQTPFTDQRTGAQKHMRQVQLSWELSALMSDGRPFSISRIYTLSWDDRANLRKDLESWRGRPFTGDELKAFDLYNILGVPCLLGVSHKQKADGKIKPIVSAIMSMPKTMKPHALVNPKMMLILSKDEFDKDAFAKLSERMQEMIRRSPEYAECVKDQYEEPTHHAEASPVMLDDEIPF